MDNERTLSVRLIISHYLIIWMQLRTEFRPKLKHEDNDDYNKNKETVKMVRGLNPFGTLLQSKKKNWKNRMIVAVCYCQSNSVGSCFYP